MNTKFSVVPLTIAVGRQVIPEKWHGLLLTIMLALLINGCVSSGEVTQMTEEKIHGPKVVALDAGGAPWTVQIQNRLKKAGFKVLRWSSRTRVAEQTERNRIQQFNKAEARYILQLSGQAPLDWGHRCVGGGFKFDYLDANLIDVETNETILNINGKGYSEDCPPMSGSIFQDIVDAVNNAWQ
jgi:hypothetical protein